MVIPLWRSRLFPEPPDRPLASWLTEPGSLTARCQAACHHFRIRLLRSGVASSLPDEAKFFGINPGQKVWVREVVLECDGGPVIYAHTVLPLQPRGRLSRWLAGLGSRSLGSLLFSHPGFNRGPIEFRRLDARHSLLQRAAQVMPGYTPPYLWARRSAHSVGRQTVLVTEAFLPQILLLHED